MVRPKLQKKMLYSVQALILAYSIAFFVLTAMGSSLPMAIYILVQAAFIHPILMIYRKIVKKTSEEQRKARGTVLMLFIYIGQYLIL